MTTIATSVANAIEAGFQTLSIDTMDTAHVEDALVQLVSGRHPLVNAVLVWDVASPSVFRVLHAATRADGLSYADDIAQLGADKFATMAPDKRALASLRLLTMPFPSRAFDDRVLVVMRNLHIWLKDPVIGQTWLNAVSDQQFTGIISTAEVGADDLIDGDDGDDTITITHPVLILGTGVTIPPTMAHTVKVVDAPLPTRDELAPIIEAARVSCEMALRRPIVLQHADRLQLQHALLGLPLAVAENTLALATVNSGRQMSDVSALVREIEVEKARRIREATSLQYINRHEVQGMGAVGGFDAYKDWIRNRAICYSEAGEEHNLDMPKGVVLLGIPGTGKSLVARATAQLLQMPLIVMDVGALFGSLVGESESRMKAALRTIDSLNGAVVLIDEAEKLWGGASSSNGDSGVSRRVFGAFLTWLNDKKDRSFVIMTMNTTDGIPPEMLRAGRFDAIFYTDLPTPEERRTILEIHMRRRGVDPARVADDAGWAHILNLTENCVGSELEQIVVESRLAALTARQDSTPTCEEVAVQAKNLVKLITLDPETIQMVRNFCATRARPVSTATNTPAAVTGRKPRQRNLSLKTTE